MKQTLWFSTVKRVVVLLSNEESLQPIIVEQELKPSYSSLSYDEVFYLETQDVNNPLAKLTLLCPTMSHSNLTEKLVNAWLSKTHQWLNQHKRHYNQMYGFV